MKQNRTHTRKGRKLVSLFLVTILALTCVGCSKKKTPTESYEAAFKKTFKGSSSLNDLLGLDKIAEKTAKDSAHTYGFTFDIQNISGTEMEGAEMLSGFGITLDAATDFANRKSHATLGLNYGGATQVSVVEHLEGSKLSLGIPELFNGNLFVDFSTLADDLKADTMINALLGLTDATLPDVESYMGLLEKVLTEAGATAPIADMDAIFKGFGDNLVVKSVKKDDIYLPEGVSGKTFYTVTVPAENITSCLEELMNLGMSLQDANATESLDPEELSTALDSLTAFLGDLSLNVAVNKDGYITYMGNTFSMYGMDLLKLDMTFSGTKSPFDAFALDLSSTTTPLTAIMYQQNFDKSTGAFEIDGKVVANGATAMTFGTEGSFTDVKKGEAYTVDFDYVELNVPGQMSLSFGASYYTDATKCEIPALTGPSYNFFYLTEDEMTTIVQEAVTALYSHPLISELLPELDFE